MAERSLRLRLTEAEHTLLQARAAAAGYATVSEYVLARCLSD